MTTYADATGLRAIFNFITGRDCVNTNSILLPRHSLDGIPGLRAGIGAGFRSERRGELSRKLVRNSAPTTVIVHEREERAPASLATESEPDEDAAFACTAEESSRSAPDFVTQESSAPPSPALTGVNAELSARDRRKLRQEKRTASKEDRVKVREEIEVVLTRRVKSAKKVPIEKQKDLSVLTGLGPQWYLVQIGTKGELAILDHVKKSVRNQFPDAEIEMFYPTVPAKVVTRGGGISSVPVKLTPGIAYMRTTLSNEMHSFLKGLDGVRGFYGKRVGHLEDFMVVPEGVKEREVAKVLQRIEDETREFEVWKMEVTRQKEELATKRIANFPSVGSRIRVVVGGLFHMCEGRVSKIDSTKWKLTAVIEIDGGSRVVELGEDEFEILQR